MKVLIVHASPEPLSFNSAMTRYAIDVLGADGHAVRVSDLYAMHFDPVSDRRNFLEQHDPHQFKQQIEELHASETGGFAVDILAEIEKLEWCDALIMQFPLWWFGLPAILKGWVDRVMVMGRVYGRGRWYDAGAFKGKRAMLSLTTGSPEHAFREGGLHGDMATVLYPINHGILRFTGFDVLPPFIAWSVAHVSEEMRRTYLEQYGQRLRSLRTAEPIVYPPLSDYDEDLYPVQKG